MKSPRYSIPLKNELATLDTGVKNVNNKGDFTSTRDYNISFYM